MKKIVLGIAAAALLSGAAFAADPMAGAYGNTLVSTAADGSVSKIHVKADKSYTGVDGKGNKMSGTWDTSTPGKLCVMAKEPAPPAGKEKTCSPDFAGKKVGDTWETTSDDGTKSTVSIVAGE